MLATFTANLAAFLTVERMQVFNIILIKIQIQKLWEIINRIIINSMRQFYRKIYPIFIFLVKNVILNF